MKGAYSKLKSSIVPHKFGKDPYCYYVASCPICFLIQRTEVLTDEEATRVSAIEEIAAHIKLFHKDEVDLDA